MIKNLFQLNKNNYKIIKIIVTLIVVLYFSSFLFQVAFSTDENVTMALVNKSYSRLLYIDSLDVHPPLYYLCLKLFLSIITFWTNSLFIKVIFARVFSFIFFILFLRVCLSLLKFCNVNVSLYWQILIFLFVPSVVNESSTIRMYSMSAFLLVSLLYELIKFVNNGHLFNIILVTILFLLSAYTFYPLALSAGFFVLIFLVRQLKRDRKKSIELFVSGLITILLYIPWLGVVINQLKLHSGKDGVLNTSYIYNLIISLTQIVRNPAPGEPDIKIYSSIMSIVLIILSLNLICYSLKFKNHKFNSVLKYCLIDLGLTLIFTMIICRRQYRPNSLYPVFGILMFLLIYVLISKLNKLNIYKFCFNMFGIFLILLIIMYVPYTSLEFSKHGVQNSMSSITLVKNISKCKSMKSKKININNFPQSNNPPVSTQYSIYLQSINKQAFINRKIMNMSTTSQDTVNNSKDYKLVHDLFPNLYFK